MITIAVEDILSEVALRKVLQATGKNYNVVLSLSGKGCGYLKAKASSFNDSAKGFPILMLTDQDTERECAPNKILDWLGRKPRHPNFLFRVAVMEVEAWIMGDRAALAEYIQVPLAKVPERVDTIEHPKEFLVNLARSSGNSSIRDDFVPRQGATSAVGPNYNGRLVEFVKATWDVKKAARCSPSLSRTFDRLAAFTPVVPK